MIRFTQQDEQEIVSQYRDDGRTANAIARDRGVSETPIKRVLQKHDVYDGQRCRAGHDYTYAQHRDMAEAYRSGDSIYAIAKRFGVNHPQNVWRILKGQGVKFRDNAWKGGRVKATGGYVAVAVKADDPLYCMANVMGYVLEHRLVLARSIGRPLTRSETVHHMNGDRLDNRLENLQLRQGRHGKGARFKCLDCGSHNVESIEL